MYDKRIKGCLNEDCERCIHGYNYKSTDRYCTMCGVKLAFVCKRCHKPIEDTDIDHKLCPACEAYYAKMKADGMNLVKEIPGGVVAVAGTIPAAGGIVRKFVKKDGLKKLIDGAIAVAGVIEKKKKG